MSRTAWSLAVLALALLACASGCGGSSNTASTSTSSASAAGRIPPELFGTYTTKLSGSDLPPNAPPELAQGSNAWTLKIIKTGAVNNGPGFSIVNDQAGELETSPPSVSGDRITLDNEECGSTGSPVQSIYRYKLVNGRLTLIAAKNGCPDKVALTVLTARAWTKER